MKLTSFKIFWRYNNIDEKNFPDGTIKIYLLLEGKFFIFLFSLISTFCSCYSTGSYQSKTHAHVKFNHGFFFHILNWYRLIFSLILWGTKNIFFNIAIYELGTLKLGLEIKEARKEGRMRESKSTVMIKRLVFHMYLSVLNYRQQHGLWSNFAPRLEERYCLNTKVLIIFK